MMIAFTLSMPHNNAWNGRWTGEDDFYAKVRRYSDGAGAAILERSSYYYNFGDGWGASVAVRQVDSKEAARIRRKSKGFCGYDWMIDSIERHGRITAEVTS